MLALNASNRGMTAMRRWIVEKLQEWLILVLGLVVIGGSIAIGALFRQSTPDRTSSVQVAATTQNDPAKPSSAPQTAAQHPLDRSQPTRRRRQRPPPPTANPRPPHLPAQTRRHPPRKAARQTTTQPPTQTPGATMPSRPASQVTQTAAPMMHNHAAATAPTTGQSTPAAVASTGDAAAGRQVFRKCQACHSLDAGKNGLGPSLAGISSARKPPPCPDTIFRLP